MKELLNFTEDALSIKTIFLNLSIGTFLGLILKWHFEKFSSILSGKKELSRILTFLILIICLIISIVKSSLALSLGLVGALSIVRFRTPIKEPEELTYLFMAIAIGLGLGANQTKLTVTASLFIFVIVALIKTIFHKSENQNLYINVNWNKKNGSYENLVKIITKNVSDCEVRRLDDSNGSLQASFLVDIKNNNDLTKLMKTLNKNLPKAKITFIDQSRIVGV